MLNSISLSRFNTDSITLKLSKTHELIFRALEKCAIDISKINANDISGLMEYLNENSRRLNNLLTKNKKISLKVQTYLDVYSFYNKSFSKSQMKLYNEYLMLKNKSDDSIKNSMNLIYDKKLIKELSSEILSNDNKYNELAKKLTFILDEQNKAIRLLNKIVSKGNKFIKSFKVSEN